MTSKIEWTEETWNPIMGCTPASAGCKNCYAKRLNNRYKFIPDFEKVTYMPERIDRPRHWRNPKKIFVCSMSDMFHETVPKEAWTRIIETFWEARQHTYIVLTKRPEIMKAVFDDYPPPNNVLAGITTENQKTFDMRFPFLMRTNAKRLFLSVEPMLEKIKISPGVNGRKLDWVICGGESGTGARPFNIEWAVDLLQQCKRYQIPFFMKQIGARPHNGFYERGGFRVPNWINIVEKTKGNVLSDWPDEIRVRENFKEITDDKGNS
jgi:protein gp37